MRSQLKQSDRQVRQEKRAEDRQRKERALMRVVEDRHRLAPLQKQRTSRVQAVLQALCGERLKSTPGYAPGDFRVTQGLARVLAAGRAASTDTKYFNAFLRVQKWASLAGVCALPMLPFHFMRYLYALFEHSQSKGLARGNIDMACAAVERFHLLAGHVSPTADAGVQEVRKGMGRELGVKGQQALPLSDSVQQRLFEWLCGYTGGDSMVYFVVLLTVAVMREGVLRWDDVSRVEFRDVLMTEQYARVFVCERRTDLKREGSWSMLPHRVQPWSAYQLLLQAPERFSAEFRRLSLLDLGKWLLKHAGLVHCSEGREQMALNPVRVACWLEAHGGAWLPKGPGTNMPYNMFLDRFRAFLKLIGEDPSGYSTHSMRRGGATELRQRDIPEELIAQHGGWKSRTSMMKYFDGSIEFARRAAALRKARMTNASSGANVSDVALLDLV